MKSLFVFLLLSFAIGANAHSGRTDASGCHNDKKNGGYHCHNPKSVQQREPSSDQEETTVVFNTKSKKYHRHNCKSAKSCTVNCVTIDKEEAKRRGGVPCGNCGG